uniref:carbonic anhydrase n=1 Tax=Exaiptasia diaphana TaxID=2652724 RepID=A0A1B0Y2E2_EXADI|nr:alpha carbonic anhydrase 6 [Exaiptasia diaphana]
MKLAGASWSYSENGFGPKRWSKRYVGFEGDRQSPINIVKEDVLKDSSLGPLLMSYGPSTNCTITNDGRTLQIAMCNSGHKNVLCGGPLAHTYQLAMIRFHWSTDDSTGSEHQIDGNTYPLEMQFLHWNRELYKNIGQALTGENGLCIVAVFFQVGDEEHEALIEISRLLSRDDHKGCFSSVMKTPINPADFIPGNDGYWTYPGSMTTPPLTENVTWIVYQTPMAFSQKQMEVFRGIRTTNGDLMVCNSRPLCPTNDREVREPANQENDEGADVNGIHETNVNNDEPQDN